MYGAYDAAVVSSGVKIVLNGGTVRKLYGTVNAPSQTISESHMGITGGLEIVMDGATVTNMQAKSNSSVSVVDKNIVHYKNAENITLHTGVLSGFDALKLTDSTVNVPSGMESMWNTVTQLQMTDNSKLTFFTAPTAPQNQVNLSVTRAGETWNTTEALIVAPANTSNMFVLETTIGHQLNYDPAVASWTLANHGTGEDDNEDDTEIEDTLVLYVVTNTTQVFPKNLACQCARVVKRNCSR